MGLRDKSRRLAGQVTSSVDASLIATFSCY